MSNLTLPSVNAADSAASSIGQAKRQSRTLVACSIGNAFEMYGLTVHSFFATSIGRLFFPPTISARRFITELPTVASSLCGAPVILLLMDMPPAGACASGLSVIQNICVALPGGSAQFIGIWLLSKTGDPLSLAIYILAC